MALPLPLALPGLYGSFRYEAAVEAGCFARDGDGSWVGEVLR